MNKREFMFLLIVTFVVFMLWIVSDLVHTRASIEVSSKLNETLQDVNPNLDQEVITQVSRIPSTPSFTTPVLNPAPTPSPIASPSAQESSSSANPL